jgi:glucose/arabinose dehydrogenase
MTLQLHVHAMTPRSVQTKSGKSRSFAALAVLAAAGAQATTPNVEVIAEGLDNPRGLAFAPSGQLYVAEAGSGGSGACRPSPDGQPVEVCYGETGADRLTCSFPAQTHSS